VSVIQGLIFVQQVMLGQNFCRPARYGRYIFPCPENEAGNSLPPNRQLCRVDPLPVLRVCFIHVFGLTGCFAINLNRLLRVLADAPPPGRRFPWKGHKSCWAPLHAQLSPENRVRLHGARLGGCRCDASRDMTKNGGSANASGCARARARGSRACLRCVCASLGV